MWHDECNGVKWPSAQQVLVGLWQFYSSLLDRQANGGDRARLRDTLASYQRVFTNLTLLVNFKDINKPFTYGGETEYDLWHPTSKACFLVLFLYSIEPPFYFHLNDACRTKNKTLLPMLGPFAYAIYKVLLGAERRRGDAMKTGWELHGWDGEKEHALGWMSGSVLVFRGALLPSSTIAHFAVEQGKTNWDGKPGRIYLPGVTSTSLSFKVALQFAKVAHESMSANSKDLQSVLFAICLHNWKGFHGFRMDSALYGAHPGEQELLLCEGVRVAVLGVEDMLIDNSLGADPFWDDFNHKTVTVVYLFHTIYF